MGGILGVVAGVAGGLFKSAFGGGIFSVVTGFLDYLNKKKQIDKDIRVIEAQTELAKVNASGAALIETLKMQASERTASYEHDTKTLNLGKDIQGFFTAADAKNRHWFVNALFFILFLLAFMVDALRTTWRPVVGYLLIFTTAGIAIYTIRKFGIESEVLKQCTVYALYGCVDSAAFVIGWYFGDRMQEKVKRR